MGLPLWVGFDSSTVLGLATTGRDLNIFVTCAEERLQAQVQAPSKMSWWLGQMVGALIVAVVVTSLCRWNPHYSWVKSTCGPLTFAVLLVKVDNPSHFMDSVTVFKELKSQTVEVPKKHGFKKHWRYWSNKQLRTHPGFFSPCSGCSSSEKILQVFLVGGLVAIFGIFPWLLGCSSSQLTFIFFRGSKHQPDKCVYMTTFIGGPHIPTSASLLWNMVDGVPC